MVLNWNFDYAFSDSCKPEISLDAAHHDRLAESFHVLRALVSAAPAHSTLFRASIVEVIRLPFLSQ